MGLFLLGRPRHIQYVNSIYAPHGGDCGRLWKTLPIRHFNPRPRMGGDQAVEAHPDLDYTKAASMVLMDGLMQRVSTAEDDFAEMPLDKAGRLIASLSRNATYEKRVRQEMKKKAELAFEQLEAELMAAIKQHPELVGELHDVLSRAREKVLSDAD